MKSAMGVMLECMLSYFSYSSVVQSIICSALVGIVGYLLVFHTRLLDKLVDKPIYPQFISVPSTMLALILAFMVSSVWESTSIAKMALQSERVAIQRLFEFPIGAEDIEARRTEELNNYVSLVKNDEWGTHFNAVGTKDVDDSLGRLKQLAWELDLQACREQGAAHSCQSAAFNTVFLTTLLDLEAAREQRLSLGSLAYSGYLVKWVVVHLLALITVFTIAAVHQTRRQTAAVAISIFCVCICLLFSMIGLHIQPYKGLDALQPLLLTSRG